MQAYIFIVNNVLVPLEKSRFVIFHVPTKHFLDMTNRQCNSVKVNMKSVAGQ